MSRANAPSFPATGPDIVVVDQTVPARPLAIVKARPYYPVSWPLLLLCCAAALFGCLWLIYSPHNAQELLSVQLARTNAPTIFGYLSADNPSPLYYLLVHYLAHWIVPTLTVLRFVSLLCYVVLLPLAYVVGTQANDDRRVGWLAAALLGLSPFMVWFSSRAVAYALLALIVLLNAYFFVAILQRSRVAWIGYVLSGLIGLGVHYFFIAVLLTQLLFGIMAWPQLRRLTQWLLPLTALVFVGAMAAWILASSRHTPAWGLLPYTARPSATNVFIIFIQFLFGFQAVETLTFLISLWPLLVILALLAVQKYIGPPLAVRYYIVAAFAPVVALFLLGWMTKPLFLSSYFIVCLPPFMLVLAWYLVSFELPALIWVRSILLMGMAAMLLIELAHPQQALSGDYLGTLIHQPAFNARLSAYAGHQMPAAGPPLHVPSDSPGALTQRK